jgi:hypothetical protein
MEGQGANRTFTPITTTFLVIEEVRDSWAQHKDGISAWYFESLVT